MGDNTNNWPAGFVEVGNGAVDPQTGWPGGFREVVDTGPPIAAQSEGAGASGNYGLPNATYNPKGGYGVSGYYGEEQPIVQDIPTTTTSGGVPSKTPVRQPGHYDKMSGAEAAGRTVQGAAAAGSSMAATMYGGLEYLDALLSGNSPASAMNRKESAEDTLSYTPDNIAAQAASKGVQEVATLPNKPFQAAGEAVGEKLAEKGYPAAGAAVNTAIQGAGMFGQAAAAKKVLGSPEPVNQVTEGIPSSPKPIKKAAAPIATPEETPPESPQAETPLPSNSPETGAAIASPKEQAIRTKAYRDMGISEVPTSAITGDKKASFTDFSTSNMPGEGGARMKTVLDNNDKELHKYSSSLADQAGGIRTNLDSQELTTRGTKIVKPIDDLSDWWKDTEDKAYQDAKTRSQGHLIRYDNFEGVLGEESAFANAGALRNGILARLKELKMGYPEANAPNTQFSTSNPRLIRPSTADKGELLRQYLNEQWTPQTSRLIGRLKDALGDDVVGSAGSDIFGPYRALRTQRDAWLERPNGIRTLTETSGPNDINRITRIDKVPDKLVSMEPPQLAHIRDVYQQIIDDPRIPANIKADAQTAITEIKTHFLERMNQAGSSTKQGWNSSKVDKFLNNTQAQRNIFFSPEELAKQETLRNAGKWLEPTRTYTGQTPQKQSILSVGLDKLAGHGGAAAMAGEAVGELTGIPGVGAGLGWGSSKLAEMAKIKLDRASVEKRITKL